MKSVGKPDAGKPHVRFDERGWETGRRLGVSTRAQPRLYHPKQQVPRRRGGETSPWLRTGGRLEPCNSGVLGRAGAGTASKRDPQIWICHILLEYS